MKPALVLFGAGNIGRSFIGQLFARHGYEVVFVDINATVVEELNRRGRYDVVIQHPEGTEETLTVSGVRAIDARDTEAVISQIAACDLAATAVGAGALTAVARLVRSGLTRRLESDPQSTLDVILAENVHDAAAVLRDVIMDGPDGQRLARSVGLVRTSIGKMVPIVPEEIARRDPLLVFAEPYNTLIVDARGFRGAPPRMEEIHAVDNIRAYVERKLFVHNLGHAAVAYTGFQVAPERVTIASALEVPEIRSTAEAAMGEAIAALSKTYPSDLPLTDLLAHREDLLHRFANPALGDTVYRVGRDLRRKLARDDRLVGAMRLAARHDLPIATIAGVYRAALGFLATDEHGGRFPGDDDVVALARTEGVGTVASEVSKLDAADPVDGAVIAGILGDAGGRTHREPLQKRS